MRRNIMGICKCACVRGMTHEMIRQGVISFPDAKYAEEAADMIADNLGEEVPEGMPEGMPAGIPEVTGEEGLSPEEAAEVMDQIVDVADQIAEKISYDKTDQGLQKAAASVDYPTVAHTTALALMEKAAGPTDVTGDGQHQEQFADGGMAEQDIQDNPSSAIVVPQGTSNFSTAEGEIGAVKPQDEMPGDAPPIVNEVAKLSHMATLLKKLSMEGDTATGDGTPGSSTGKGDGRLDLSTNIDMPKKTVVRPQGSTSQTPVVPVPTKPNPAAAGVTEGSKPTTDVQKEGSVDPNIAKVAAAILAHPDKDTLLAKLAKELPPEFFGKNKEDKDEKKEDKAEDKADKKKEESKEEESEKEASLFSALSRIAAANV
jgi:hypothetical protein